MNAAQGGAYGLVLDAFAGPGGWDEGARSLGMVTVGIEWDDAACRTAKAAGHARIRADVAQFPLDHLAGKVTGLIMSPPCQDFSLAGKQAGIAGDKGQLIREVLRWTDTLRPRWVACEQVPPCLPIWQEYAEAMRGWGYRTWTGVLNAADYGVAQTRKRAILLASLDRQPSRPEPTHARGGDVDLFGERQPWVSMADALGWTGELEHPRGTGMVERHGERPRRREDDVSFTVTGKARSWVLRNGAQRNATERGANEPAPTLVSSMDNDDTRWVAPAGAEWAYTRPATALCGDSRLPGPGHRCFTDDCHPGRKATSMFDKDNGSVRVTVEEAAILQSFPRDYPWQGSRTKQFEQVGNAVPPRLAMHVLAAATGIADEVSS